MSSRARLAAIVAVLLLAEALVLSTLAPLRDAWMADWKARTSFQEAFPGERIPF